jgi:hypothetical protein
LDTFPFPKIASWSAINRLIAEIYSSTLAIHNAIKWTTGAMKDFVKKAHFL